MQQFEPDHSPLVHIRGTQYLCVTRHLVGKAVGRILFLTTAQHSHERRSGFLRLESRFGNSSAAHAEHIAQYGAGFATARNDAMVRVIHTNSAPRIDDGYRRPLEANCGKEASNTFYQRPALSSVAVRQTDAPMLQYGFGRINGDFYVYQRHSRNHTYHCSHHLFCAQGIRRLAITMTPRVWWRGAGSYWRAPTLAPPRCEGSASATRIRRLNYFIACTLLEGSGRTRDPRDMLCPQLKIG